MVSSIKENGKPILLLYIISHNINIPYYSTNTEEI